MRIHDFSEIRTQGGELAFQDRLRGMVKYGFSWPQDVAAQEKFISMIERDIDQRYTLFRNFPLPKVGVDIPILLAGPPGLSVILLSRARGIFRAKDDQWLELSGKNYRPAKENLIRRLQLFINATQKLLGELDYPDVNVDGLIVGMNPGMHVDAQRSAVRVVQFDALRRLGAQLSQEQPRLSAEQVYKLVAALSELGEPQIIEEKKPSARQMQAQQLDAKFTQNLAPLQKKMSFNTQQWIILALILFGTVVVLLIFMFLILLSL